MKRSIAIALVVMASAIAARAEMRRAEIKVFGMD